MSIKDALGPAAAVVAVDVGKTMAAVLVTDAARQRLLGPLDFPMTVTGVSEVISKTRSVVPAGVTRVGVEAAGHYHRPLASPVVWPDWELVELNPAHVTEQRRVMGRRRVKTDALRYRDRRRHGKNLAEFSSPLIKDMLVMGVHVHGTHHTVRGDQRQRQHTMHPQPGNRAAEPPPPRVSTQRTRQHRPSFRSGGDTRTLPQAVLDGVDLAHKRVRCHDRLGPVGLQQRQPHPVGTGNGPHRI